MVKFFRVLCIIFFVSAVCLFLGADMYIKSEGRRVVLDYLKQHFDRPVSLGSVSYRFPLTLRLRGLNVQGAFGFDDATIRLGVPDLVRKRIVITDMILQKPSVALDRNQDALWTWSYLARAKFQGGPSGRSGPTYGSTEFKTEPPETDRDDEEDEQENIPKEQGLESEPLFEAVRDLIPYGFVIERLRVNDGRIKVIDYLVRPEPLRIKLEYIHVNAESIVYPAGGGEVNLEAAGTIGTTNTVFQDRWFEFNGWINPGRKDMDVDLRLINPDGTTGLEADLISRDNDMTVSGRLRIQGADVDKDGAPGVSALPGDFWNTVNLTKMNMDVSFTFDTEMDDFRIGEIAIKGNLGLEGIPEALGAAQE